MKLKLLAVALLTLAMFGVVIADGPTVNSGNLTGAVGIPTVVMNATVASNDTVAEEVEANNTVVGEVKGSEPSLYDGDDGTVPEPSTETPQVITSQRAVQRPCADELKEYMQAKRKQTLLRERMQAGRILDQFLAQEFIEEMDAVISVADENGIDVTELQAIRDDASAIADSIEAINETNESLGQLILQMRDKIREFKRTAHDIETLDEYADEIREKIKEVRSAYREKRRDAWARVVRHQSRVRKTVLRLHACLLEERARRLETRGYVANALREKAEEMLKYQGEIETAVESGDFQAVREYNKEAQRVFAVSRAARIVKNAVQIQKRPRAEAVIQNIKNRLRSTAQEGA